MDDHFSAAIHYGGTIHEHENKKTYVGGSIDWYDKCDPDRFSIPIMHDMCLQLHIPDFIRLYYVVPGNEQEGLKLVSTDEDVRSLYTYACASPDKCIDIYVEHGILEVNPLVVENPPPLLQHNEAAVDENEVDDGGHGEAAVDENHQGDDGGNGDVVVDENHQGDDGDQEDNGDGDADEEDSEDNGDADEEDNGDGDGDEVEDVCDFFEPEYDDLFSEGLHQINVGLQGDVPLPNESAPPNQTNAHDPSHPNAPDQSNAHGPPHPNAPNQSNAYLFGIPLDNIPSGTDYANSDELNSPPKSDSEEAGNPRYPDFRAATDMDNPQFKLGQTFRHNKEFKEAMMNYAVKWGYGLRLVKNESGRVRYKCSAGCEWCIFASKMQDGQTLQVKTFCNIHTCTRAFSSRQVSAKWVAKKYREKFRRDPHMKVLDIVAGIREDFQVEISQSKACRARRIANLANDGTREDQYKRVRDYCEELRRSNPGSSAGVSVYHPQPHFKRLYVCLEACKRGFKEGCRPLISLDACHLRGTNQGQILAAVGIDGNDGMYPLAFAVAEIENRDTWSWFLENLLDDIGNGGDSGWFFITDQQKGLVPAVNSIVPEENHRLCLKHLYENFLKKYKGKQLRDLMWAAANATTKPEFEAVLKEIENVDTSAADHLRRVQPYSLWSKHAFSAVPKCGMLLNNLCESFNSKIVDARSKPLIHCMEMIRRYLMTRIHRNRDSMMKYPGPICPKIQAKLETSKEDSRYCSSTWSGGAKFEVNCFGQQLVVDLEKHTCTCYKWDLTGIPCKHVVSAIAFKKERAEDYVDNYYSKERYIAAYSHLIQPTNGPDLWPTANGNPVLPPRRHRQPGRPTKQRRRIGADEAKSNPFKLKRHQNSLRCSQCKGVGHNLRSCKRQKTSHSNAAGNPSRRNSTFMGFKVPSGPDIGTSNASSSTTSVAHPVVPTSSTASRPPHPSRGQRGIRGSRGSRSSMGSRSRGPSVGNQSQNPV